MLSGDFEGMGKTGLAIMRKECVDPTRTLLAYALVLAQWPAIELTRCCDFVVEHGQCSLGIAMDASRDLSFPLPLTATALAQLLSASQLLGMEPLDIPAVVRLYESVGLGSKL